MAWPSGCSALEYQRVFTVRRLGTCLNREITGSTIFGRSVSRLLLDGVHFGIEKRCGGRRRTHKGGAGPRATDSEIRSRDLCERDRVGFAASLCCLPTASLQPERRGS